MKDPDLPSQASPPPPKGRTPLDVVHRVGSARGGAGTNRDLADQIAALLRLADLDADMLGREARRQRLVSRQEERRYAIAGLRTELELDGDRLARAEAQPFGVDLQALRKRIRENQRVRAQLLRDAEEAEAEVLTLSTENQRRSVEVAEPRAALGARISADVLEAYGMALRSGREPVIARLVGSVCTGCHVRLHSKLEHQIRQRWGIAACPHCLRLVYDPSWLEGRVGVPEAAGRISPGARGSE